MSTTTPQQFDSIRSQTPDALLIDVRTPAEFEEVRATGAINIPLDTFYGDQVIAQYRADSDQPVYLICKMGGRSQRACDVLAAAGFENAVNVDGGTEAWVAAGLPTDRGGAACDTGG